VTRSIFTEAYALFLTELIAARRAACVSQVELAARLKKPQSFVSKVESGARRIDVVEFMTIMHALGLDHTPIMEKVRDATGGDHTI
jgi:ribosome-binding protein aMBF1 (putative translation factor)